MCISVCVSMCKRFCENVSMCVGSVLVRFCVGWCVHVRVRMLVRACMHASTCMYAVARITLGLMLVVASSCWHVCLRQYLCLHPSSSMCFLYVRFVQDCVCVSAGSSPASSPGRLCPRGYFEGRGLS